MLQHSGESNGFEANMLDLDTPDLDWWITSDQTLESLLTQSLDSKHTASDYEDLLSR